MNQRTENTAYIAMFLKLVYRLNTVPMGYSCFLCNRDTLPLKCAWNNKESQTAKTA